MDEEEPSRLATQAERDLLDLFREMEEEELERKRMWPGWDQE
jgi:hypothetical protein